MRKIVIATFGSLGDVYPFVALGKSLQRIGCDVVIAGPQSYVDLLRSTGLAAHPIFPSHEEVGNRLGWPQERVVENVHKSANFCIREFLLPTIASSFAALMEVAADASAIVGQFLALSAPIVAEKLNVPFIPAHLHPMSLFLPDDPPSGPQFPFLVRSAKNPLRLRWNRSWFRSMRRFLKFRYARHIDPVRISHGLAPSRRSAIFDLEKPPPLELGLFSESLVNPSAALPRNMRIVGFPFFDEDPVSGRNDREALAAFLASGPAPIVFTLGSLAVHAPGEFFRRSAAVAGRLRRRAVILTGEEKPAALSGDVFVCRYASHAALFPLAAAVVHHGGVGTTGQALRAGAPQLVVPHMGDQWDNAARIERIGVGQKLPARRYTAARAEKCLHRLLNDASIREQASATGKKVRGEAGAESAARLIEACVSETIR